MRGDGAHATDCAQHGSLFEHTLDCSAISVHVDGHELWGDGQLDGGGLPDAGGVGVDNEGHSPAGASEGCQGAGVQVRQHVYL